MNAKRLINKFYATPIILLILALVLSACGAIGGQPAPTESAAQLRATADALETTAPDATATNTAGTDTETFTYVPGGEGFGKWATDVVHPAGYPQGTCGRVWQATNLINLPWTTVFCNWKASNPAPKMQWPHPTQLTVSGNGTVEFELWRDSAASKSESPDPYVVANAQHSSLGLGWFTQGFNGNACINDKCQELSGGGVFQLAFPHDMTGSYHVVITVRSGQVQFWQGEKITSTDNWPLP